MSPADQDSHRLQRNIQREREAGGFANEKPNLDVTIANLERQLNDAYFQRYLLVHQRRAIAVSNLTTDNIVFCGTLVGCEDLFEQHRSKAIASLDKQINKFTVSINKLATMISKLN